jgi:hypothetical protein
LGSAQPSKQRLTRHPELASHIGELPAKAEASAGEDALDLAEPTTYGLKVALALCHCVLDCVG